MTFAVGMACFVDQRPGSQAHALVVEEGKIELRPVVDDGTPLGLGDRTGARGGRASTSAAPGVELVDRIARKSTAPLQNIPIVRLTWKMRRRICETPNTRQRPAERLSVVADVVVPETLIPIVVVEVESVPCPVDERLPTNAWPVEIVTRRIQVRYDVGTRSHG